MFRDGGSGYSPTCISLVFAQLTFKPSLHDSRSWTERAAVNLSMSLDNRMVPSAYSRSARWRLLKDTAGICVQTRDVRWSTTQLKRSGAAPHPGLTALLMLNYSESFPFMRRQLREYPQSFLNSLRILPGTPMHARIARNEAWSTESNAAFRSMKAMYKWRPLRNSRVFSMMRWRADIWSIVERFGMKQACCGRL